MERRRGFFPICRTVRQRRSNLHLNTYANNSSKGSIRHLEHHTHDQNPENIPMPFNHSKCPRGSARRRPVTWTGVGSRAARHRIHAARAWRSWSSFTYPAASQTSHLPMLGCVLEIVQSLSAGAACARFRLQRWRVSSCELRFSQARGARDCRSGQRKTGARALC